MIRCQPLPALCVYHAGGEPVYRSPALERIIPRVLSLTWTDAGGRRFYRRSVGDGWRRLRTAADVAELNRAIDRGRA